MCVSPTGKAILHQRGVNVSVEKTCGSDSSELTEVARSLYDVGFNMANMHRETEHIKGLIFTNNVYVCRTYTL